MQYILRHDMKENKNEIFMYCIYNILALSLARSCAACVSSHMAAKLQNPKINLPLTNTTGLNKNSHVYQGIRYTVYDLIRINYTCDNDTQPLSVLDL